MDKEQVNKELSADELKKQIQVRLGQRLRATRARKEMTITGVSSTLKIHATFLKGLEEGDWSQLPDDIYAIGFLRQYATLLGEDIHEDVDVLKSGDYQLTKPFTMPDPPIAPNKMWAIAAGILFILLFILFNAMSDSKNKTPLPESSGSDIQTIPAEKITAKQTPTVKTKMQATLSAQSTKTPSSETHSSTGTHTEALHPMKQQPSPSSIPENIAGVHHYRFMAVNASVWLQVHDPAGVLLKEALLHPGQSFQLKSSESFLSVTCGNAAALKIEVDDKLYADAGTLGEPEKVLHNFKINISNHDEQTRVRQHL